MYLRRHQIAPGLVLCSSSVRTRETLERISFGFAGEVEVQIEEDLYAASAGDLLARLREVSGDVDSLMVIGHAPAIPELALRLAGRGADVERLQRKFPTAALATLSFEGSWQRPAQSGQCSRTLFTPVGRSGLHRGQARRRRRQTAR